MIFCGFLCLKNTYSVTAQKIGILKVFKIYTHINSPDWTQYVESEPINISQFRNLSQTQSRETHCIISKKAQHQHHMLGGALGWVLETKRLTSSSMCFGGTCI